MGIGLIRDRTELATHSSPGLTSGTTFADLSRCLNISSSAVAAAPGGRGSAASDVPRIIAVPSAPFLNDYRVLHVCVLSKEWRRFTPKWKEPGNHRQSSQINTLLLARERKRKTIKVETSVFIYRNVI